MEKLRLPLAALLSAALLAACGGGSDYSAATAPAPTTPPVTQEPGAPVTTGNTATDGYNWFNYRRAQVGLSTLARNSLLDAAAQGHADYQRLNRVITHQQTPGQPGFTGVALLDRLRAAGYPLGGNYAAGEVISATTDTSGFYQAEELITAIYHRFVIFEPKFREMGTGASTTSSGYTYFTADMATHNGFGVGLGKGQTVTYPKNGQTQVPTSFDSDTESPDPVPNLNRVGYPVSIHSDIDTTLGIKVTSFTIRPRGGVQLNTRLLSSTTDEHTSMQSAAIVPLTTLLANTTYDVSFVGTVDGIAVTKNWSFTTK